MAVSDSHLSLAVRRQNALRLEEKERKEKESRDRAVEDAEDFKADFYAKRNAHKEAVAKSNREKEKVFGAFFCPVPFTFRGDTCLGPDLAVSPVSSLRAAVFVHLLCCLLFTVIYVQL